MLDKLLVETEQSTVGRLGIIAMRGCETLGGLINDYIKEWRYNDNGFLVKSNCPRFATGEAKGVIEQTVRGYDIFIISDCFNYGETYNMYGKTSFMSPDDHFQDLKRIIAALGGKARRITVIMPMLYEGRQHKRQSRESLDCAIALGELVRMGVSNILTFDAHDPRVQNAIPLSGFDTISPSYQMIKALLMNVDDIELTSDKALIISPDEGGMSRCLYYSSLLKLDVSMFYKRRDYSVITDGRNPIKAHEFLGGGVEGKDVIIIDDMISAGDSILDVAGQLKKRGAKRIFAFVTFGLFTGGFEKFDHAYEENIIDKIFSAQIIYRPSELLEKTWHCGVDLSKYIAKLIDTLNYDESLSEMLNPANKIKDLLKNRKLRNEN